eukprot:7439502-Lingulodinium_polyedra.AAC.1
MRGRSGLCPRAPARVIGLVYKAGRFCLGARRFAYPRALRAVARKLVVLRGGPLGGGRLHFP